MFILLFPLLHVITILWGYKTKDKISSVLIGMMPFSLMAIILLTSRSKLTLYAISYWIILIIILGLEGYFASKKEKSSPLIACGLCILWFWIFFSGIN